MLQQVQRGRFVGADDEAAGRFVAQLGQGIFELVAQAFKALREIEHGAAGVGEDELFGGAVDELFAQLGFEAL